jgi:hypothetical protein
MPQITDGMQARPLGGITWRKGSHSNPYGNCVELAELAASLIAVRNSRHSAGPVLVYPRAAMTAFVQAVKEGEFDGMAG